MVASNFDFSIQNEIEFKNRLDRYIALASDLRIPLKLIASDFYRSQKKIFGLQSEGLYPPLGGFNYNRVEPNGLTRRRNAEDRKERLTGHAWAPILYGKTGDLKDSTLSPSHKYSVYALARQSLIIGTSVPYGKYHQSDGPRKIIPQRKFIFIDGGPADRSRDSAINGRRERWASIIETHLQQVITGRI